MHTIITIKSIAKFKKIVNNVTKLRSFIVDGADSYKLLRYFKLDDFVPAS
jgi:hypothetical protein